MKLRNSFRNNTVGGSIHGPVNSYNTIVNSEHQRLSLANWVSTLDFSQDQSQAFERYTEGTLRWVLEAPEFVNWLSHGGMLWMPGKPGAGKTVLASFIVDYLRKLSSKKPTVCYVYCRYDTTRTTLQIFEAILKQLILRCPSADIKDVQAAKDEGQRLTLNDIITILQEIFDQVQNIFIAVDAFDECFNEGTRNEVLLHLQSLTSAPILITSRPLPDIESFMTGATKLIVSAHNEDVKTHIRAKKRTNPTLDRLVSTVSEAEGKVVAKADGSFLLAQLHITYLAEQTNTAKLRYALEILPDKATAIYEDSLKRIRKQSPTKQRLAFHALSWILYAMRVLKLIELRHALAIKDLDRMAMDDELDDEESIISSCAGLIELNKESHTVAFIHYTVQEFLQRACSGPEFLPELAVATSSLKIISFPGIQADPPNYPLIDYATFAWGLLVSKYEHKNKVLDLAVSQLAEGTTELIKTTRLPGHDNPIDNPSALSLLAIYGLLITCVAFIERHPQDAFRLVDEDGHRALMLAIQFNNLDIVKLFLESFRVNVNSTNIFSEMPLSVATNEGNLEIVKLLLSRPDINVNLNDEFGRTPLSYAAERGHLEITKLFLSQPNIDVNLKDITERTPLSYAEFGGHSEIVNLLLGPSGINVNLNKWNSTPLTHALESGHSATSAGSIDSLRTIPVRSGVPQNSGYFAGVPISHQRHYRTELNDYAQRTDSLVQYSEVPSGPQSSPTWLCVVYINGIEYGRGTGSTRNSGSERAAQQAIWSLSTMNYRTELNNYAQRTGSSVQYSTIPSGPQSSPTWLCVVYINGIEYGRGTGSTRSSGSERAAQQAIWSLSTTS